MKHLIVCREYAPASYPPGGIGTYVRHISRLLAEHGHTVHVIAQRWEGASARMTQFQGGRLVIHRIGPNDSPRPDTVGDSITRGLAGSDCPSQAFSWQVASLAEHLVTSEGIDVIEAPEWEAPLYYFQLRRALGMGPRIQPPCLIHLHSPSELIFRHNGWDLTFSDYEPLRRMERYSVQTADAVICPSRYLARDAELRFGLNTGQVHVIPYPMGDTPWVDREPMVWMRDSLCYVGRLELRKGVIEWVDAAVQVATAHPTASFDFFGSDTSLDGGPQGSVRRYLQDRIPSHLRTRFRFHGNVGRGRLLRALANSPIAVVPSRWDNLPYSCIEAMSTGLPVVVSSAGGMRELISDGESGWIAEDPSAAKLAAALQRALATSPEQRAKMGRQAATAVRGLCANETVLGRHVELRAQLGAAGASRSTRLPAPRAPGPVREGRRGLAVFVTYRNRPDLLARCLAAIEGQTQPAFAVTVIGPAGDADLKGLRNVEVVDAPPSQIHQVLLSRARLAAPDVRGVVFVDETVRLEPQCLAVFDAVFERHAEAGLVAGFLRHGGRHARLDALLCPGIGWSLDDLQTMAYAALRTEALQCEATAEGTWAAVSYPDVLASSMGLDRNRPDKKRLSPMALAQRASVRLSVNWFLAAPWRVKARWLLRLVSEPRQAAYWVVWQFRDTAARAR